MSTHTVRVSAHEDGRIVAEGEYRGVTVHQAIENIRRSLGVLHGREIGYSYNVYEDCRHCCGDGLVPVVDDDE